MIFTASVIRDLLIVAFSVALLIAVHEIAPHVANLIGD